MWREGIEPPLHLCALRIYSPRRPTQYPGFATYFYNDTFNCFQVRNRTPEKAKGRDHSLVTPAFKGFKNKGYRSQEHIIIGAFNGRWAKCFAPIRYVNENRHYCLRRSFCSKTEFRKVYQIHRTMRLLLPLQRHQWVQLQGGPHEPSSLGQAS